MASKEAGEAQQPTIDEVVELRGGRRKQEEGGSSPAPPTDLDRATAGAARPKPVSPPVVGMGWVARDGAERMGLRTAPEDDPDAEPEDTSAYARPSASDDEGHLISPRITAGPGSPLEGAGMVPVISVDTSLRAPLPDPEERPAPPENPPIPRITILSSPGPGQVCPTCKGPLRVLRTTHHRRLECTWFRLEWMEIERDWADCPTHLTVETTALARPAFLLPKGQVANGLLARIVAWRWQDHMPGHDITRLLASLGLRSTNSDVARWLQAAHQVIAPIAAAIRESTADGKTDPTGLLVRAGGKDGRLKATTKGKLVSFAWQASDDAPRPDDPAERARDLLLDARGWSRAGAQAIMRRIVARALATDRDRAARASWRLEELRMATDHAAEQAAIDAMLPLLDDPELADPHLRSAARNLAIGGPEGLFRFTPSDKPAPAPALPENVRVTLPRWFWSHGDGTVEQVTDWHTLVESCTAAGQSPWRTLRDIFEAFADGGHQPLDGKQWIPGKKR